ncbi:hypothetical protein [Flavicella marina]|uniref:hypothetical protein n=1 Tax=Flavicella marina TaxID=1475951 RepID=UPI00126584CB|nr:hypothetical protein [Flavicella marina]
MKKTLFTLALLCGVLFYSCDKKNNCTDFKTGTYLVATDTSFVNTSTIYKTDDSQLQISPKGDTLYAKVHWLNDCSYKLFFDKAKMDLTPFQINVNTRGGILVEFGIPEGDVMPYVSVLKGETKTETFKGYLKKVN